MRLDLDKYFMNIVNEVKQRSTCPRAKVGAVIVKNKKIISTGYNGAPVKMDHCEDMGCIIRKNLEGKEHCIRVIHAEQNALLQAGPLADRATLYCSFLPCEHCFKMCIQAGIKKIVYETDYNKEDLEYWINHADLIVTQYRKNKIETQVIKI